LGKGCLKRLDTFTVPHTGAQAAGRIHPTKNMRPGPRGCQLQTTSHIGPSNALIVSMMPAEVEEKPAG
jgi:hypothetical protein